MYVYYCKKCQNLEALEHKNEEYKCKQCSEKLLSLNVSLEQWNSYTNTEMKRIIESLDNIDLDKKDNSNMDIAETVAIKESIAGKNRRLRVCPKCRKAKIGTEEYCDTCKSDLEVMQFSDTFWNNCSEEKQKELIAKHFETSLKDPLVYGSEEKASDKHIYEHEWLIRCIQTLGFLYGLFGACASIMIPYLYGFSIKSNYKYAVERDWGITLGYFAGIAFSTIVIVAVLYAVSDILIMVDDNKYMLSQLQKQMDESKKSNKID